MAEVQELVATVPAAMAGRRLDQVMASLFPDFSRSRIQTWIRAGLATVDSRAVRPKVRVAGGECIKLLPHVEAADNWEPQSIPLAVVHEDDDIMVIDKPAGLVVHPGAGNRDQTMLNALLHHNQTLATVPRAGIVHRIDKDTTGLLVIAKNLRAHKELVEQLKQRQVRREYEAVVVGVMTAGGRIDDAIGRHRTQRTRMAVTESGKPAVTVYRVIRRFRAHTRVRVSLETGRTHQIRVHLAHVDYPLVGDPVYGGRLRIPRDATQELTHALRGFKRQALHAAHLELLHPVSGEMMAFDAPLPDDMSRLLACLAADESTAGEHRR